MTTLTLTSKRQATFPIETCKALGLKSGDIVELEERNGEDGRIWVLRPRRDRARPWIGSLSAFAKTSSDHSMAAVRTSIEKGRKLESVP
jgi:bifunctional DNA-binding transcriptional regulator/antitoxin component of YhaV-PrlF toxin-antitoxin module